VVVTQDGIGSASDARFWVVNSVTASPSAGSTPAGRPLGANQVYYRQSVPFSAFADYRLLPGHTLDEYGPGPTFLWSNSGSSGSATGFVTTSGTFVGASSHATVSIRAILGQTADVVIGGVLRHTIVGARSSFVTIESVGVDGLYLDRTEATISAWPATGQGDSGALATVSVSVVQTMGFDGGIRTDIPPDAPLMIDSAGYIRSVAGAPGGSWTIGFTSLDDQVVTAQATIRVINEGNLNVRVR